MTTATSSLRTESWPIERLMPYAQNARTHSEEQVTQIAASIEVAFRSSFKVAPPGRFSRSRILAVLLPGRWLPQRDPCWRRWWPVGVVLGVGAESGVERGSALQRLWSSFSCSLR